MDDDNDTPTRAYQKRGRDTPQGRQRYQASRYTPTEYQGSRSRVRVTTAEGADVVVWRTNADRVRKTRDAVQWAAFVDNDGTIPTAATTVVRCNDCWRWTSRPDRCDDCTRKNNQHVGDGGVNVSSQ